VIGIVGALGNMNLTSSNFPLLRQFSANPILGHCISAIVSGQSLGFWYAHQPAPLQSRQHPFMYDVTNVGGPVSKAMQHEDGSRLLFECWDYKGLPTCHGGDRAYE
jgi:hypothetical protein